MSNDSLKQVFLGYNILVQLQVGGDKYHIFCTQLSISFNQQIMASSGIFSGKDNIKQKKFWLSAPHRVDYTDVQISINFQVTQKILEDIIIKKMLNDRMDEVIVSFYFPNTSDSEKNGADNSKHFQMFDFTCFWTNLSLDVQQGALMTCSMSFISVISKNKLFGSYGFGLAFAENYINQSNSGGREKIKQLGKMYGADSQYAKLIPYYSTGVYFKDKRSEAYNNFKSTVCSWNVQFQQNIIKKNYVYSKTHVYVSQDADAKTKQLQNNNSNNNKTNNYGKYAPTPFHFLFGVLVGNFKCTILQAKKLKLIHYDTDYINNTRQIISSEDDIEIRTIFGNNEKSLFTLSYCTLQSVTPNIAQQGAVRKVQYAYLFHGIKVYRL